MFSSAAIELHAMHVSASMSSNALMIDFVRLPLHRFRPSELAAAGPGEHRLQQTGEE
jgi:hypothetical protein